MVVVGVGVVEMGDGNVEIGGMCVYLVKCV